MPYKHKTVKTKHYFLGLLTPIHSQLSSKSFKYDDDDDDGQHQSLRWGGSAAWRLCGGFAECGNRPARVTADHGGDDEDDENEDDDDDDDDDGCHLEHEELHISRGKTSWVLLQVLHSHHH